MLAGKTLTEFTNLLSPNNVKRNDDIILKYLKNGYETHNIYPNLNTIPLSDQQQCRINKINEIKDYFVAEIKKRELISKTFSKYIASFGFFDKSLIVLSITTDRISIASFSTAIEVPVGIASAVFSLAFSISAGIVKKLLKTTRNKKKKYNKIVMPARSKLNSIESKISEALLNNEVMKISWQLLMRKKYREPKEGNRMMNTQRSDSKKST